MINTAPPASNTIYDREKCFKSREDKGDREGIPHTHPIP